MCGRCAVTLPHDAMAQLFAAQPANNLPEVPNFNVCPTTQVSVVVSDGQNRRLNAMRWGFIPQWYKAPNDGPLLINARGETIAEKPAFKAACRSRRCLIPVSGFYEWQRNGDSRLPWYITRSDGDPLVMAGIWQNWSGADGETQATCAIVTTGASADISAIHHRMPVILERNHWFKWIGEEGHGAARLMQAAPSGTLQLHRVSRKVNSNRASGPDLIEPFED